MIQLNDTSQSIFSPIQALIFYRSLEGGKTFVESYDFGPDHKMKNAHPLTIQESALLAECLREHYQGDTSFLMPEGLLAENVLYLRPKADGFAIWYTQARRVALRFSPHLDIAEGLACIPPLIWKASRTSLTLYAAKLPKGKKPKGTLDLYHAPFFNIYTSGSVCMGTVDIQIPEDCNLEEFMSLWEEYFFGSYFSHSISNHSPAKTNIVELWKSLVKKGNPFPLDVLVKTNSHLQDLIHENNR